MRTIRSVAAVALAVAVTTPLMARADVPTSLPDDAVPVVDGCGAGADHQVLSLSDGDLGPVSDYDGDPLADATLVTRFVQLSDTHVLDDDGPDAANGTPTEVVLDPLMGNTSATFLNEEFTDEVLNAMIETINGCNTTDTPLDLTITTGDITDTPWLNVVRRVINNIDGTTNDTPTAFEANCGYITRTPNGDPGAGDIRLGGLLEALDCAIPAELLAVPTGSMADDAADQSTLTGDGPGPDVEHDALYQLNTTRALRQGLESALSAAANGSATLAAGLPPALDCTAGTGCENSALGMPFYATFGNHDATVKGTVTYQSPFGAALLPFGRYFFTSKREYINEWFFTQSEPIGHGFGLSPNLGDTNNRNDGWYSFVHDGLRFVILDTTYDGVQQVLHRDGQTTADTQGLVDGDEVTNPFGLEAGYIGNDQFQWLQSELDAAKDADEPVLVFSHHPDRTFVERQYPDVGTVDRSAVELDQLLGSYPNVVAHIAGHTHANRVNPCPAGSCVIGAPDSGPQPSVASGFWRFETASLINWPQEGRIVEVFRLPSGEIALRLTQISPRQTELAERSHVLSGYEAMCSVHQMMGGPLTGADAGTIETLLGNVVAQNWCPDEARVGVGPNTPAGALADRDVILLP